MTTQAINPSLHVGTFGGVKQTAYTMRISDQYLDNVITINPQNNSGVVTIRAAIGKNTGFEDVENGKIDLSYERTIRIAGYPLRELEFTLSETVPITVWVKQSTPVLER